jgi:hypothetical protein
MLTVLNVTLKNNTLVFQKLLSKPDEPSYEKNIFFSTVDWTIIRTPNKLIPNLQPQIP